NDGKLDLLVVHYARWPAEDRYCGDASRNIRIYCHPKYFDGLPSTLYRNRGDGTFQDVSEESGIAKYAGRGMSVAFADYDGDGFMDAFVTNDNMPNFLFHNRGNGTFPLFRNLGKGAFADAGYSSKLGLLTIHHSGWGTGLFDFNNDGWKDLFTANSHVNDLVEQFEAARYKEPNGVFLNLGNGTFRDVSAGAGQTAARAHRGSAYADLNGDGRIDVVVSCLGEPAEVWENLSPAGNWIILKLVGVRSNRDGIGASIRIGDQYNHMTSAVSYASSSH